MAHLFRALGAAADEKAAYSDYGVTCDGEEFHRRLAGGGGANIFELDYGYVDNVSFWIVFVGMVAFCVLVDRTQALLDYLAEGSPTNERFLQKVYTELLMFGVVAVTIFMMVQITSEISARAMTIITFIDVLCSMGACTLIAISGVLSVLRKIYWKHWISCELADQNSETKEVKEKKDTPDDDNSGPPGLASALSKSLGVSTELIKGKTAQVEKQFEGVAEHTWAHAYCATTPETYKSMSKLFKKMHQTPPEFKYHFYLAEVLTRSCCELMSINWASWVILMTGGCLAILVELVYTEPPNFDAYVTGLVATSWSLVVFHVILLVLIRRAFTSMIRSLEKEDAGGQNAVGSKWGERTQWSLQIIHLFNCFCLAFYLMHGKFNLRCESAGHHVAVAAPLVFNICVMLPLTLPRLILVEAFYALDPDALDNVLSQGEQADEDLRYMLARWMHRGCPDFNAGNSNGLNLVHFTNIMMALGMHAGPARIKRIFMLLDVDNSGTVDMDEFLGRLKTLQGGGAKDGAQSKEDNVFAMDESAS